MAPPFASTSTNPWIYFALGCATTLVVVSVLLALGWRTGRLDRLRKELAPEQVVLEEDSKESEDPEFRIDNIGLSKKAEDVLREVLEEPRLQNELPDSLEVSKATVSNAVSELKERGLIRRKKKANTYLIEPDETELEEVQR